ncbi:MAG: T9SS type A sorting domain-containing protein [Winogradskyella sp.]|nr:MAG: T9SS type A sorting domain-containing protein [Winogradskyella sp.]
MKKIYTLSFLLFSFLGRSQVTPVTITSDLTADLSGYTGATEFAGQAEYFVYLSTDDILDRPIFLIDGFDPGDTRNIDALYASLDYTGNPNFTNLGDELRAEGFDIVVVNFPTYMNSGSEVDGGADFIERNALTLIALIEDINTEKAIASSPEQNIIIGPSMGGLISRYALNYMEGNMLDSDTSLWISLDAPHLGANIPIGLQHQLNFLAFGLDVGGLVGNQNVTELQPLINDYLYSPAARQLLVDHIEPHLAANGYDFTGSTLPIPDDYRIQFETNINSFNSPYPQNTRNIAVTNGNVFDSTTNNYYFANGDSGTQVGPGFEIINASFPVSIITVDIVINMTPTSGTPSTVSSFSSLVRNSSASSGTDNYNGIDAAPGGLFDLTNLTGDVPMTGLAADFLAALQIDKFSFIPTVSALGLEITEEPTGGDDINWFHDINITNTRATTDNTPFDNTYIPLTNETHVAITPGNATFILDEIRQTVLSSNSEILTSFQLESNPIKDKLVLLSNSNQNTSISIMDLTGKLIFKTQTELNNRTEIPVNLNSGFYILNIEGENNSRYTTKFIVN